MPSSLRTPRHRALLRRLVALREAQGLTQEELARRLGKQQSYISKTETGERRLDVIEFIDLVRALGADPVDVVAEIAAHPQARSR